jgi:hypothetical protein
MCEMIKMRNKSKFGPRQHNFEVWGLNWTWNSLINGTRDLINKCQKFRDQSEK